MKCHDGIERPFALFDTGIHVRNGAYISIACIKTPDELNAHSFFYYLHEQDKYVTRASVVKQLFPNRSIKLFGLLFIVFLLCLFKAGLVFFLYAIGGLQSVKWLFVFEMAQVLAAIYFIFAWPTKVSNIRKNDVSKFTTEGYSQIIKNLRTHFLNFKDKIIA